ncbi:MAG: DUF2330 domain-containing protein [Polyangiaceae bacterium]
MNRLAFRALLAGGAVCAGLVADRPARACGGCFQPVAPKEVTVVTDHRMAFAVSPSQSVLWDQIEYSGSPQDFSWVLPVKSGTVVQLSSDQWFSALDAMTTPSITGPSRPCSGQSSNSGCGAGASSSVNGGGVGGYGVQVVSQSVVGPYDTATLHATDPGALENWLTANGYDLPAAIKPTVSAYVAGGFDFIALRLQPGVGVKAMQPVRVVTQGADLTLPLRMVAAGIGAQVGITLYVVSEGRYEAAPPFFNGTVDDSKLFWFHTQNRSNYQEQAQAIMQGNGGRTWLTEYSQPVTMDTTATTPCAERSSRYFGQSQSLADLYLSQCPCLDDASAPQTATEDAQAQPGAALQEDAQSSSAAPAAPLCTGDDLAVALTGLDAASVWVTRLRAVIPAGALSEHDLLLQASSSQTPVSSQHTAATYDDPSYSPCGTNNGGCAASASDSRGALPWVEGGALCVLAAAGARRRHRSAKRRADGDEQP